MKTKILSFGLVGLALVLSQNAMAAEKLLNCMTLGGTNHDERGVRIYESDEGKLRATVDDIKMFHNTIYYYNPVPLLTADLKEVHLCGGLAIYFGPNVSFYPFGGPQIPGQEAGDVSLTLNGQSTNTTAITVAHDNVGYCD